MNRLVIPHQIFDALASGRGGAEAGRFLAAAARDRHLILVKAVADAAESTEIGAVLDALAGMHAARPESVDSLLRYPSIGAWALSTLRALCSGAAAHPEQLRVIAATAAVRAGLPFETRLSGTCGSVMFPSLGRAILGEGACLITVTPAGDVLLSGSSFRAVLPADPTSDSANWRGVRPLLVEHPGGSLRVAIDDLDPYRFPGVSHEEGRLSHAEFTHWRTLLQQAWAILRAGHSATADEISAMILMTTPLPEGGWAASGTSRTAIGCVALARPTCARRLAATLAHEVQHAKLTVLLYLVDLISSDVDERYYAPWRHDPRPLTGLLHGTYAHLGVADFWRRQRHVDGDDIAHAEFARWREAAAATARVISNSAALTSTGVRFVEGMMQRLQTFYEEDVPSHALTLARRATEQHRHDFQSAYRRLGSGEDDVSGYR
ncbi:HEXXH motif domain-containing protein [Nonomuraea sp. NPDC055795]